MSRNAPIVVPIATSYSLTATLTLPWFVQRAEYNPGQATFKPLVNGAEAFGAVYDAIAAAQHTIDIICWGFQPSMYFKRGGEGQGTLPIGELLEQKGKQGIQVRLLVWSDSLHAAQFSENMMPGNNMASSLRPDTRNSTQHDFDRVWYRRANLNNATKPSATRASRPGAVLIDIPFAITDYAQRHQALANVEFATRDFNLSERAEIAWRSWIQGTDTDRSIKTKDANAATMSAFPTHHQKMVLVDYEHPERAIGFVMGHNTLDEYWDTDRHSHLRQHPQAGRNGKGPRQDISSRVTGPILRYLNKNFCQAWDDATGQQLAQARAAADAATAKTDARRDFDTPVMAQILRTQPQHGKDGTRDIEKMYLQAINNTTGFAYIENQYFRFPPLADKLKWLVAAYQKGGRDTPLHLFVVTNDTKEGMGDGTVNTYRMLATLGRADTIENIARLERTDALKAQYKVARKKLTGAELVAAGMREIAQSDPANAATQASLDQAEQQAQAARAKAEALEAQIKQAESQAVTRVEIPGLNVHICTLVAPDSPPGTPWTPVYVHSKLMVVDDVFMTLGSANVNTRSMMVDSELNICHEHEGVTQPLRERLWDMHTKGMGVGRRLEKRAASLDVEDAFRQWGKIIKKNNKLRADRAYKESPYASLVEFNYTDTKRTYLD